MTIPCFVMRNGILINVLAGNSIPLSGDTVSSIFAWRLNAGDQEVIDSGSNWHPASPYIASADTRIQTRPDNIVDAELTPQPVFDTEIYTKGAEIRIGPLFVSGPGPHNLRLIFAEQFHTTVGARTFDLYLDTGQGDVLHRAGIDVFAEVGINKEYALNIEIPQNTTNPAKFITIALKRQVRDPMVNAVQIISNSLAPPHHITAEERDGSVLLSWSAWNASGYELYQDGILVHTINDFTVRNYEFMGLTNGVTYNFKVKSLGTSSENDSDLSVAVQATPVTGAVPSPTPVPRLGLHVTLSELLVWHDRALNGPYKSFGDRITNSPGDWDRIVSQKIQLDDNFSRYAWLGPTYDYPNAVINDSSWPRRDLAGAPGQKDNAGAAEVIRDAAFWAMALGSVHLPSPTINANIRDNLLIKVRDAILLSVRSKYLDFTNTGRWDPNNFGNGFHPGYQIARWLVILDVAYDYAQIANPNIWSISQKSEYIEWRHAMVAWFVAMLEKRRNGIFNSNGSPTAFADEPNSDILWHGGPRAETVHTRMDNHTGRLAYIPVFVGHLARMEKNRSGLTTLTDTRIDTLLEYGSRHVRDYVIGEFIASQGGTGGGSRSGGGNFYRAMTADPTNGWKYAMEHLGHTLVIADLAARSGDFSSYEFTSTSGTSASAGILPNDGLYGQGGPKNLRAAMVRLAWYVNENSNPIRYGHKSDTTVDSRIDSRSGSIERANEWELLHSNIYFRDNDFKDIYLRRLAGTPTLPSNPKNAQHWIAGGSDGLYAGVNLQFAELEGIVDPYPEAT